MLKNKLYTFIQYFIYRLRAFHLHGIHSPFVYAFQKNILEEKLPYYAYDQIESIRAKLLLSKHFVNVKDFGAGSKINGSPKRSIHTITKNSAVNKKNGQLLFRLAKQMKAESILELGTSLGIGTSYLASANPGSKVFSLEGSTEVAKIAQLNFNKIGLKNIELIVGSFEDTLGSTLAKIERLDLVYFDGNHTLEPTLRYFNLCLEKSGENSIYVFDDIYWSPEMQQAWKQIIKHPKVTVSIDLFQFGLVFFKSDQEKEHFTIYH